MNHAARKGCCSEGYGDMYATSFYPDIQGAPLYPPDEPDGYRYFASLARASPSSRRLLFDTIPGLLGAPIRHYQYNGSVSRADLDAFRKDHHAQFGAQGRLH